ncbi:MAG: lipoprotein [Beijerinckiaceae bacterium]
MITRKSHHIGVALCLFAVVLSLAGCGRKNDLDSPSVGAAKEQKRTGETSTADQSQKPGATAPAATDQGPLPFHKQSSFILDPLL